MKSMTLVKKYLPQNPDIEVYVPNYKEPILPVNGGFGWHGLMSYNEQGQPICHECGEFRDNLGYHIVKHGLHPDDYRSKYGLLSKTKLTSKRFSERKRIMALSDIENLNKSRLRLNNFRHLGLGPKMVRRNGHETLEYQNKTESCPAQVLRWLVEASEIYGGDVTESQIEKYRPGLGNLAVKRYGSLNKAKQLAKLKVNLPCGQLYTKQLIIEDMCSFYYNYGRWPKSEDYENGKLICSRPITVRHGGLKLLRQEAMKLREEQEARRIRGEQIVQYANDIEFANAGYARK